MPHDRGQYVPSDAKLAKYNITREHYDDLFFTQGGLCAICLTTPIGAIDHCHQTGEFRGLLCRRCNVGLGMFKDAPQSLYRAVEYLRKAAHRYDPDEHDEENDSGVPRQPDGWIKGSPWPLFGYTVELDQSDNGAWLMISRGGEIVGEIGLTVPPQPRAKAEIWVRRKWRNEFPIRDTGTFD